MPSEPSTRTQLYLTDAQRRRLDAFCRTRGIAMAEAVREAVDAYLDREYVSCAEALDRTWGSAPKAEVPSRDEWDAPRDGPGASRARKRGGGGRAARRDKRKRA